MKKYLLLLMGLLFCSVGFAQEMEDEEETEEVEVYEVDPTANKPRKSPALLPHVSYSSQNLYVWSPYTIDMLQMIIRDEDDDIIYSNVCMPLIQGMTTFALPSTVCTDKYSIELIYGEHHLIGYF
ncbi:MAG: DUF3244 domain-containing protein [Prevotella sp.]|nr:DUF3244 domain-containing protein [Prevotella sp.]